MQSVAFNQWLLEPPEVSLRKQNIVVYSSCHTWSLVPYLRWGRPDLAAKYNVYGVVIHLARAQSANRDPRFVRVFESADVILHHPLDSDRWDGFRVREFKLKPGCRLVTMESPQISCLWPVLVELGEGPTIELFNSGATPEGLIALYDAGEFPTDFETRLAADKVRMAERDAEVDVKSSEFVFKHWQTTKMFSTINHPTFHVYVWMLDQFAGILGFPRLGEEEALRVRTFAVEGDGHYPETEYEFRHYGFQYPMRFQHCMGGPGFYHEEIRKIHARWKATRST